MKKIADGSTKKGISLASKWAPTLRCMYDKKAGMGVALSELIYPPAATKTPQYHKWRQTKYRLLLSKLRKASEVTERKMADGKWAEIEPEHVASVCNLKNRYALQNRLLPRQVRAARKRDRYATDVRRPNDDDRIKCAKRYEEAIMNSLSDKKTKKIKGSANQPHAIVEQCHRNNMHEEGDDLLEAMWAELKSKLVSNSEFKPGIPMVDVSASMNGTPMNVATALGILMAQLLPGPWHGLMLNFDTHPQLHSIAECTTLHSAVRKTRGLPWGGSTNFSEAMDAILNKAVQEGIPEEDLPETLFVFSDMQFDQADRNSSVMGVEIKERFKRAGYSKAPHIVFWNLRATGTPNFQADAAERGVSIMSGFSQQVLKDFLEDGVLKDGVEVSPIETLFYRLHKPCFEPIRSVCEKAFK
eukprot:gb/GECG01014780.1/.p1 GENE.gb/GECG01014780.1/~~gb/GECG01014780.1/.p1  ORF type:complete len:414 (+),score=51.56 gb/GECG01014780.1/:1-1242(+)